jgi:hypothetical protein
VHLGNRCLPSQIWPQPQCEFWALVPTEIPLTMRFFTEVVAAETFPAILFELVHTYRFAGRNTCQIDTRLEKVTVDEANVVRL